VLWSLENKVGKRCKTSLLEQVQEFMDLLVILLNGLVNDLSGGWCCIHLRIIGSRIVDRLMRTILRALKLLEGGLDSYRRL
jgi:hypothetical protein